MTFSHRAIPIVLAAVLIDTIGFSIVIPVFPALVTSLGGVDLEAATRIAGYLIVIFALTQFVAGPITGALSDQFGRRPVLIASMLAFAADFALTAYAPSLAWLFVARAVAGAAGAVYGPAAAVIADVTPPDERAGTFGLIGAAFGLGFIIGPAIGGLLSEYSTRVPFLVAAGIALANALVMLFFLPETLAPDNRRRFAWKSANIVGAFAPLARAGGALPLIVAWFLWQVAHSVYPATWSFWTAIVFGWSGQAIGWSLMASGVVLVLVQTLVTRRVIGRVGERVAVLLGLGSGTLVFAGYAFATQGWMAYALIVAGLCQWFVQPAMSGLLSNMVGPDRQGALQGGISAMGSVASIFGPLMLTQALASGARAGFPGAAFAVAALLSAVALAIVGTIGVRGIPPRPVATG